MRMMNSCKVGAADGRPRLLGELMLSRAMGDLPYRNVGLTAEPEFTPWRTSSSGELSIHAPQPSRSEFTLRHVF